MASRILIIHWNELSFPDGLDPDELSTDPQWKEKAVTVAKAIRLLFKIRPDAKVSFAKGTFHHMLGGRAFQSWLEDWLGKDAFRQLRAHAVQPRFEGNVGSHELDCELRCQGRAGEGITRAHLGEQWSWSFCTAETLCDHEYIEATKIFVDSPVEENVRVPNLSNEYDIKFWTDAFLTWGSTVSSSHLICELNGYQIIMYPLDHGYPHIHVKRPADPKLNAKYRVDTFEALTSKQPSELDTLIKSWVQSHSATLQTSWVRCQSGLFPIKIAV